MKPTAQFFRIIIKNTNILNKFYLIILILFGFSTFIFSQTYEIYKGDTVNFTDNNNLKQGLWHMYQEKTKKIIEKGAYVNNVKEGIWTAYYSAGTKKSEITYQNGQKRGYARIYFENGNIAEEGNWDVDKWTGKYITYYSNGKYSYLWNYDQNGKRHGYQKYYYPDGKIKIEGEWENGKENGIIKEYFENGKIKAEKSFIEGEIDSNTVVFYDNVHEPDISDTATNSNHTKIDTVKIFSGNGYFIFYNKDKKIEKEGNFNEGILYKGKHNIYNENGILIKVFYYEGGKIIRTDSYEENSQEQSP